MGTVNAPFTWIIAGMAAVIVFSLAWLLAEMLATKKRKATGTRTTYTSLKTCGRPDKPRTGTGVVGGLVDAGGE